MKNRYGLDQSYFEGKLSIILRDIANYTPDEIARALSSLANAAYNTESIRLLNQELADHRKEEFETGNL